MRIPASRCPSNWVRPRNAGWRPIFVYAHCIVKLLRLGCATAALRPSLCALSGSFSHALGARANASKFLINTVALAR